MKEIIKQIENWAIEKGLHEADSFRQFAKHVEEGAEYLLAESNTQKILELGDNVVTLTILALQNDIDVLNASCRAEQFGRDTRKDISIVNGSIAEALCKKDKLSLEFSIGEFFNLIAIKSGTHNSNIDECAELAYNKIASRTGKMVDGVFVKSEDLPEGV